MMTKLKEAYDPEQFKSLGYQLVDLLYDYLKDASAENIPANNWEAPEQQLAFWQNYELDSKQPIQLFEDILQRSIHLHHPRYIGHQICPPAPTAALAGLFNGLLNNGMAVYEMGAAATAIEKIMVNFVAKKLGYPDSADGFLTSGGTLANLTALLTARSQLTDSNVWENGTEENFAIMVASEAHYCIDRAVKIMGWGAKGLIKIPVGDDYTMRTELLESHYQKAQDDGIRVIAVVGSAPSTSAGMYDNLESIAQFCATKKLWFHVDGAHGGAAIFSEKYKHLLKAVDQADSVVIDAHKMLMTPALMTFLLFKDKTHAYSTFSQKAEYLLAQSKEEEWYNIARRSFECTKHMMSIKLYSLLKIHGEAVFDQFVSYLYDLGKEFAQKLQQKNNFELALQPDSNIVCFRYIASHLDTEQLNQLNSSIRQQLLEEGKFYIVQTSLNDVIYLRTSIMNPQTTIVHLEELLEDIELKAKHILQKVIS